MYYLVLAQVHLTSLFPGIAQFAQSSPTACKPKQDFFGFPTWYKYLAGQRINRFDSPVDGSKINICSPKLGELNDIWLIGLASVEILLRIIVLLAIFYVLFGGVKYIDARGNADKIEGAKNTVLDALKGLAIAIVATAIVSFIGRQFSQ